MSEPDILATMKRRLGHAEYLCAYVEDGEVGEAESILATSAEAAAEECAEDLWSANDYPTEQTIRVTSPDGEEVDYIVTAEPATTFSARRKG